MVRKKIEETTTRKETYYKNVSNTKYWVLSIIIIFGLVAGTYILQHNDIITKLMVPIVGNKGTPNTDNNNINVVPDTGNKGTPNTDNNNINVVPTITRQRLGNDIHRVTPTVIYTETPTATLAVTATPVTVTDNPTINPTVTVTDSPTVNPTVTVTDNPTVNPIVTVTDNPTVNPTVTVTEPIGNIAIRDRYSRHTKRE